MGEDLRTSVGLTDVKQDSFDGAELTILTGHCYSFRHEAEAAGSRSDS
jgi:hypothetical protein